MRGTAPVVWGGSDPTALFAVMLAQTVADRKDLCVSHQTAPCPDSVRHGLADPTVWTADCTNMQPPTLVR